jgi:hypothetical protein
VGRGREQSAGQRRAPQHMLQLTHHLLSGLLEPRP